ncbi:TPA: hypothetical protein BOS_9788 [Bos taurus]|nr:TPA: hypothetical protein BOS_9788 [Bos taurus]
MALALSLPPGVLPGLPKEQPQFTPRSASTPCLLHSAEQHKSRESGGGDALRRGGSRSRWEQAGSTSPGPSPTQLIRGWLSGKRDWLSGKEAALRSPNSDKTGSSRPEMSATCAARLCRYVSKKGSGEQTTRSPFSCRQIRNREPDFAEHRKHKLEYQELQAARRVEWRSGGGI